MNPELIELTKEHIKEAKRLIKDHEHEKEHEFLLKILKEATQNVEEYLDSRQKKRIMVKKQSNKNEKNETKIIQDMLGINREKVLKEQQEYKEKNLIISALCQANRNATKSTLCSVKTLLNEFKDEELDTISDSELVRIHHTLIMISDEIQNMKNDIDLRIKSKEKLKEELGIKNPITFPAYNPSMMGIVSKHMFGLFNPVPMGVYKPQGEYYKTTKKDD